MGLNKPGEKGGIAFRLPLIAATALCAATLLPMAAWAHDGPFMDWYSPSGGTTPTDWTAWTASVDYWQLSSTKEHQLPANGDCVRFTSSGIDSRVFMEEGDSISDLIGLVVGFNNNCNAFLELRRGSHVHVKAASVNANFEGVWVGYSQNAVGNLCVNGTLDVQTGLICVGGKLSNAAGTMIVDPNGIVTNRSGNIKVGSNSNSGNASLVVNGGRFVAAKASSLEIGGASAPKAEVAVVSNGFLRAGWVKMNANSSTAVSFPSLRVCDSEMYVFGGDWSASSSIFTMSGAATTEGGVYLTNAVLKIGDVSDGANYDRNATPQQKMLFQSLGKSVFVQSHSVVTNYGVWFRPARNDGDLLPSTPPRYEVDGGELYVLESNGQGEIGDGYSNGSASSGICAFTNAPMSFTVSMRGAAKVSIPRVNTTVLVSGQARSKDARTYATTTNRPHFEFVLSRDGHAPYTLRRQNEVMGMFSVWPEGGMQLLTTNRLPLVRHSNAATSLSTADEPQFRAPNADLWNTGAFTDIPNEWGVSLKASAEIAAGVDLGAGVRSGYVVLPKKDPENVDKAYALLKVVPQAKSLAEIVAGMCEAGYGAEVVDKGGYNVKVNLLGDSPLLSADKANVLVFDFTTRQSSVDVRDGVAGSDALLQGVTFGIGNPGLMIFVR